MRKLADNALRHERDAREELERALGEATAGLATVRDENLRLADELAQAREEAGHAASFAERLATAEREAATAQSRERRLRETLDSLRQHVAELLDA
jgi:hypothetical protein